ncbi:beta-lactamase family protein [bacterium]|nr:beta-lactamase family protein [bacterium]
MKSSRNILLIGFFTIMTIVSIAINSCSFIANEQEVSLKSFSTRMDEQIPDLMDRFGVPGLSLAFIRDGKLVWSNAYGYADLEEKREMSVDSICRAESISKSVTAWGVMRLVEQGLIDLDVPVQQYINNWQIPDTVFDENAITVRKLLSNTAGMPQGTIGEEYNPGSIIPSLEENLREEARLIQNPGQGFLYSNPGYNLLELLVEETTGDDFSAYMDNEVLDPLGMAEASYDWNISISNSLPMGYDLDGNPVSPYIYPASASGGLFATVEDIARFVIANINYTSESTPKALKSNSIETMHSAHVSIPGMFGFVADSYGFGFFLETLENEQTAIWHGGQGHGWMTHFHAIPSTGDGIVILTNSQRSWPLLAEILREWSAWIDISPVKFSRISLARKSFNIILGFLTIVEFGQIFLLISEFIRKKRTITILQKSNLIKNLFLLVIAVIIIGGLIWAASQPYLFILSIFPGSAVLAWYITLIEAVLILVYGLSSKKRS